jgi:hypothetical protein
MRKYQRPPIQFLCASPNGYVSFSEELLDTPVPLARPTSGQTSSAEMTYRAYLQGIEGFIFQRWDQFVQAASEQGTEDLDNINLIDVVAEKHGSDYHPARIIVHVDGPEACFAANVAITHRGKERLENDYHWLRHFRGSFQSHFVPKTYFLGSQTVFDSKGRETDLMMFLAEWLDGYHEFHLSRNAEPASFETLIWDMDQGYRFLTETQSFEIYRQASFILTYYYDVETFREVFPWHHASGDFVVHVRGNAVDVKMITVRQYEPRTVFLEDAPENIMNALLIFFANLTVRMRLDRLDGVGEVAWAGDRCVEATIQGFSDAMKEQVIQGRCSSSVIEELTRAFETMSVAEWAELFRFVVESYDESAPDVPVIIENLADHVFHVYSAIQSRYETP